MRPERPRVHDELLQRGWPVVAGRFTQPNAVKPSHPPTTHGYAAALFVTKGHARVELDGEWTVREGDVLLVPAGAPHRMLERHGLESWSVGFCVSCFAANGAASLLEPFERVRGGGSAVVRVPAARREHLGGLFRELERSTPARGGVSATLDAVQRSLLTLILAEVERAVSATAAKQHRASSVVVDALRFIERNCLRPLTLKEVAKAVGRSAAWVTTSLKAATGRSAVQWIVTGRMAEARRLLLHSDERVDVIAERVGYADATHFIRMFRREHGMTPAAWRASQMKGLG